MDSTRGLAIYGAALASVNAAVQLWEKWSVRRVRVEVTILEAWHKDAFNPWIVVRNRGHARAWVAIIGVQNQHGDGFDDRHEENLRSLDHEQSVTLQVPPGVYGPGDTIVAYALSAPDDWNGRVTSAPLNVGDKPTPLPPA